MLTPLRFLKLVFAPVGISVLLCMGVRADEPVLLPQIEGSWWQVAGDPDLGKLTSEKQQPVDFGVWRAADGTWQLWSCIRHTKCGGSTLLFYGWEGAALTDKNWQPKGIAMQADPRFGETPGGLQAPHVINQDGSYYMFYGDWKNICLAKSRDGKSFSRVLDENGRPQLFTEELGVFPNTRDAMVLPIGETLYCYYTAYSLDPDGGRKQGADYCRTSKDKRTWSESTRVAFGGQTGTSPGSAECPHVVYRHGWYYLFRTQRYGRSARTSVYRSKDPLDFGINDDRYFVCVLPVAAIEIVQQDEQDYIAALLPSLKGIQIARLDWVPRDEWIRPGLVRGKSLFDLDDPDVRAGWRRLEGDISPVFTSSTRSDFWPPSTHFIGTAESAQRPGSPNDAQTGVIESPAFTLTASRHIFCVSGGSDREKTYVALVDAASGEQLLRLAGTNSNRFEALPGDLSKYTGRQVRIRIVDRAKGSWGHINFGGLFAE
ncbi:MAG: hypothetical protein CMJ50_04940 [Planctomycetaceae bacterium]|nr:hypothetical protein [Planctomycetaceae bacterium]